MPCQNAMERTPATLKISEKVRKYHFFPRKSMFVFLKNSTLLTIPSRSVVGRSSLGLHRSLQILERLATSDQLPQMLNASPRCLRLKTQSKIMRDTKTAVKRLASKPKTSVVAKPFTGPVPKRNRIAADTMVVT